ncbi:MAG: ABC transporter permease [Deltaproteobacteria bacterium]|nr:ABC transporter permease [Deltaproteobacteria bacterium]
MPTDMSTNKEKRAHAYFSYLRKWWSTGGEGRRRLVDYGFIAAFVVVIVIGAWAADVFFTKANISNLSRQIVSNGLISLGMLIVILTGGIDLSVGSIVALGGVLSAGMSDKVGIGPAILIALFLGAVAGLVNGVFIARFKLQPFIVTLATMGIVRGFVFVYTETPLVSKHPDFRILGASSVGPLPVTMIIMLACFALIWFFLNRTPTGRATVAIGGNKEAVWLAGINVQRTIILAYVLSGLFSALAGVILVSRLGIAQPSLGIAYELDAIAACVIGGAILGGGGGGAIGTFFGVLTLGMINNLLNLHGVQSYYQEIIKGAVILLAVLARRKER